MVQVAGRDTHFAGDLSKLKMVWYENVRFFDFSNYFEGKDLNYFNRYWLPKKVENQKNSPLMTHILTFYNTVYAFLSELSSLTFRDTARVTFDFSFHA